jgi:hypothetical protein
VQAAITTDVVVRDLTIYPDRLVAGATIDQQSISLLPGESTTVVICGLGDADPPQLPGQALLLVSRALALAEADLGGDALTPARHRVDAAAHVAQLTAFLEPESLQRRDVAAFSGWNADARGGTDQSSASAAVTRLISASDVSRDERANGPLVRDDIPGDLAASTKHQGTAGHLLDHLPSSSRRPAPNLGSIEPNDLVEHSRRSAARTPPPTSVPIARRRIPSPVSCRDRQNPIRS